jgi:hypothetical protein
MKRDILLSRLLERFHKTNTPWFQKKLWGVIFASILRNVLQDVYLVINKTNYKRVYYIKSKENSEDSCSLTVVRAVFKD